MIEDDYIALCSLIEIIPGVYLNY